MSVQPLSLLVVEDSKFDFQLIERALSRGEITAEVTHVQRGEDALFAQESSTFDVILMDYNLPGISGIETFQTMLDRKMTTPVVFLTGGGDERIAVDALKMGAQDYLVKDANGEFLRLLPIVVNKARQQWLEKVARQQAEVELRRFASDLASRNEELDAFAHTVAHDLKSPLSVLISSADILLEQNYQFTSEDRARILETILTTGKKMNNIVRELLLLSQIRKSEARIHPLSMGTIVNEVQTRLHFMIEEYQATIIAPKEWPVSMGYGPWIEEVWVNYLSNAIKYGGKPPWLQLAAAKMRNGMVCYWVEDNGEGVKPSDQAYLFRPFTQLTQVRAKGHGLGLSIVQRIIEKCGGKVGMRNKKGSGAIFWFMLPAPDEQTARIWGDTSEPIDEELV